MSTESNHGNRQTLVTKPTVGAVVENLRFSKVHFWAIFATIFGFYFDAIDTSVMSLALPSITKDWGLNGATAGLIGGAIFWGMMIGAASFGFIADLIGRRWVMIITITGMAVFTAASGLAQDVGTFMVFRILTGVFAGAMIPLDLSYLAEISPKKNRGMMMASIGVSWPLGALTATLLAGWLLPFAGWRALFLVMLIPALVALLVRWLVPESPRWLAKRGRWNEAIQQMNRLGADIKSADELDTRLDGEGKEKIRFVDGLKQLFQQRYIVRALGSIFHYFLAYGMFYGWGVFLPTILLTVLGYPLTQTITAVVLTNIASIAGRLTVMFTANKLPRFWTLVTSLVLLMLLALSMSIALGFGPKLAWLFFVIMAVFQYSQDVGTVFQQWVPEMFPSEIRGFAASFTSAFGRVSAAVSPIAVGALVGAGNTRTVFYLVAGIAAILIINVIVFLRKAEAAARSLTDVKAD